MRERENRENHRSQITSQFTEREKPERIRKREREKERK